VDIGRCRECRVLDQGRRRREAFGAGVRDEHGDVGQDDGEHHAHEPQPAVRDEREDEADRPHEHGEQVARGAIVDPSALPAPGRGDRVDFRHP
jgi:hypothetical protein